MSFPPFPSHANAENPEPRSCEVQLLASAVLGIHPWQNCAMACWRRGVIAVPESAYHGKSATRDRYVGLQMSQTMRMRAPMWTSTASWCRGAAERLPVRATWASHQPLAPDIIGEAGAARDWASESPPIALPNIQACQQLSRTLGIGSGSQRNWQLENKDHTEQLASGSAHDKLMSKNGSLPTRGGKPARQMARPNSLAVGARRGNGSGHGRMNGRGRGAVAAARGRGRIGRGLSEAAEALLGMGGEALEDEEGMVS